VLILISLFRGVPSEVMQILADESRKISSAILRNREAYAHVYAQLRLKALDLDKLIGQNWYFLFSFFTLPLSLLKKIAMKFNF
jgi:hypothetical protein